MTDQHGENPTEPTGEGTGTPEDATPPPAAAPPPADTPSPAPTPPPTPAAPQSGGSQYDFDQAKATLQGAHKFDLGIIVAGLIAWLAAFMPFYTASASFGGASVSASGSAYHGFFGWFAVWVALAGAVVVALALFNVVSSLPMPLHQIAAAAFGLALLCLILAFFITPGGDACHGTSGLGVSCDTGHGFGYWLAVLAVLAGLGLSVLRMREATTASTTTA